MKRTTLIAAAIGATTVFGLTGTALAAAEDDTPSPSVSVSPSDDDGGLRGDGTVDDTPSPGDDAGLRGDGTVDDPSASPSPSASTGDDGGLRGDGTVDDNPGASATPSPSRTATSGLGISSAEAIRTALAAVGSGRLSKIEAEVEHGYRVWSVEVLAGGVEHDIDVDRATGEIRRHRSDRSDGGKHGSDDGRSNDDGKHGSDDSRADDSGHGKRGSDDDSSGHGKHGSDD
ncbi:MAG: PepSY domain-containing protein [Actinoplanes sp.]